jgi:VWFA-related protein
MTGVTQPKGGGPKVLHEGPIYLGVAVTVRSRPLRLLLPLTLWATMLCSGFAQTNASPAELTFRSDANEVRITFSTTDQDNRVIGTVQPNDFAIVDQDLVVRDFRSFTRSEYTRLEVAVLLDASGSITPQFRHELTNVVQLIAQSDGVPDESFSVLSFRDLKPAVICEANCRNLLSASAQFPAVTSGGATPLYDSIVFASQMLARRTDLHTRKILVLFSDGADTISLRSLNDALDSAVSNDVAIYSVDVKSRKHSSPGSLVLCNLSANTGGRYFSIEAGASKVLDAILEDFHATYTVAYKLPSHAAGFHLVRILPTHNPDLQFHCRRGYYYDSNSEN